MTCKSGGRRNNSPNQYVNEMSLGTEKGTGEEMGGVKIREMHWPEQGGRSH